jgi:hypothetical protein
MKKYFTLLFFYLSALTTQAQVNASFPRYAIVNGNINLTYKIHRDCAGLELCGSCVTSTSVSNCNIPINVRGGVFPAGVPHNIPATSASYTNVSFFNVNIPAVPSTSAIDVVSELCGPSICDNCNTRTPGTYLPGIEFYTFSGTLLQNTLPTDACWISISTTLGNRASSNAIVPNTPFVSETFINRCLPSPNNSAILQLSPRIPHCAGAEANLRFKLTDPDGDSITMRLGAVNHSPGISAAYNSGFSAQSPFPHVGFGTPAGITLDVENGWIKFIPLGSFKEAMVIEVLEWRKVNGINTLAGLTRYDLYIVSEPCLNSPPALDIFFQNNLEPASKTEWNLCQSDSNPICFTLKSRSINTTQGLTFLEADSNPYFHVTKFSSNTDSLKICLSNLATSNGGTKPYVLAVFAEEVKCPWSTVRRRNLSIRKYNSPSQVVLVKSLGNFNRLLTLEALNNVPIIPSKTIWQIETAPNSQQFTTVKTGDSCLYKFPTPGVYKIRTLVEGNCVTTLNHTIHIGDFSIRDSILSHVLCFEVPTARVQAIITSPIGPVRYKINNGPFQNSPIFEGLAAGQYQLLAEDSIGQKDSILIYITQPPTALTIQSISITNPNCHGQNTGSIQIVASGGTAPISFGLNQNNFNSNPLFENLSAGTYLVTVVDNNNCLANDTIDITQPNPLAIDFTIIADSCTNPPSGRITTNISGGTQPYLLNWLNYQSSGQTEIDKLPSGNYFLRVNDQKNCLSFDTVFVPLSNESFAEQICTINFIESTVATKHEIKWQKTPGKRIASYQVWSAANDTAPYVLRKTILASANSSFIDSINVDDFKSNDIQYKLLTIDSCGRSSAFSKAGSSLVFTTGYDNFGPKLNWEKPNTLAIATSYEIYRRSWLSPTYNLIKTLDSNQFSFIDTNFQVDGLNLTYYVKAIVNNNCQVSEVRSPAKNWTGVSTGKHRAAELGISLFPNPTKQKVNIFSKGTASFNIIKIYGLQGNLIQTIELDQATQSYELNLPELAKGMYYISLSNKQNSLISLPLLVE